MKKCLTIILLSFITATGFAQNTISRNEVPKPVIQSYISQNSNGITDSIWSKEVISIYKVQYNDNGQRYEANYFSDGRWIKTYTEIELSALPINIVKQVNIIYPNHKIVKAVSYTHLTLPTKRIV